MLFVVCRFDSLILFGYHPNKKRYISSYHHLCEINHWNKLNETTPFIFHYHPRFAIGFVCIPGVGAEENSLGFFLAGEDLLGRKKYTEAVLQYEKAVEADPKNGFFTSSGSPVRSSTGCVRP